MTKSLNFSPIGRGISAAVDADAEVLHLQIAFDAKSVKASPLSNKGVGPNVSLASTLGNVEIAGTPFKMGLNAYMPPLA